MDLGFSIIEHKYINKITSMNTKVVKGSLFTIPFRWPHFTMSRDNKFISTRAEKFTITHLSKASTGSNNSYINSITVSYRRWLYKRAILSSYTLLLKFHLPLRGAKSCPLPTFSWGACKIRPST